MPVLRPYLMPTVGTPQSIVAPSRKPRRSNMIQQDFYTAQTQVPKYNLQMQQDQQNQSLYQNPQQVPDRLPDQEFEPTSNTVDYLKQQFANYANRTAPPQLTPGDRVKSANAELVQPDNFKMFYQQLASIDQSGQEQLGAASARAAFKRMQEMQSIGGAVPTFNGMPVGYKNPAFKGGGNTGKVGAAGSALIGAIGSGLGLGGSSSANFNIAKNLAKQFGWGASDINAWYTLGMKESGWRANAQNPTSTAYGIGQFLDSTWGGYGIPKTSDPQKQILAMARYIKARYGSPSKALQFHLAHNWY